MDQLHHRHGNALYRLRSGTKSFILKWFGDPVSAVEVCAYALLAAYGVPTLPVYGQTQSALLLEDLAASPLWRLARESDVEQAETGVAIAEWYRALHAAGREVVARPEGAPAFLKREADALDAEVLLALGEKLGMAGDSLWRLAVEHIETLKGALRSLPETLTYNDFYWTNLALSRGRPLQAIVFDYHLLGIGPAYSDCRNVAGSLGEKARMAFWEAYGVVDERAAVLDAPVSVLYSLHVATQRPSFPSWANACLEEARSGELARKLRRALSALDL